jgi:hypothetical protein
MLNSLPVAKQCTFISLYSLHSSVFLLSILRVLLGFQILPILSTLDFNTIVT